MEILYDNEYMQICFYKAKDFITVIRKAATEHMSVEEFKRDSLVWVKFIQEKKPSKMLVDGRNFKFIIVPKLQMWLNKNLISPSIQAGLKKFVYLVPEEIYVTVSLDQTLAEKHPQGVSHKLLTDIEEAKNWLDVRD